MKQDILNPEYWSERLEKAKKSFLHFSIFKAPIDTWEAVERKHESILLEHIKDTDSILDVGCGYGRLLTLMPPSWTGPYTGIDLSPEFIELAREKYPYKRNSFHVHSILHGPVKQFVKPEVYDWATMISIRPMMIRNLGEDVWKEAEQNIRLSAKRLLYLEYDVDNEGSIE